MSNPSVTTPAPQRDWDQCPYCELRRTPNVPGPPPRPGQWFCLNHRQLADKWEQENFRRLQSKYVACPGGCGCKVPQSAIDAVLAQRGESTPSVAGAAEICADMAREASLQAARQRALSQKRNE